MHNDTLGEEMAARENDRYGNAPLRRGPDPDKVAAHLATGVPTMEERQKLADDFHAAAKVEGEKPGIKAYIESLGVRDLAELMDTTNVTTFRKAQTWISLWKPTPPEALIAGKARDNFTTESPIRAFTEFRQSGTVAIGKGFRPSLAHLHTYLDAMEAKEGWTFVQILLPDSDAGDPTILFHRKAVLDLLEHGVTSLPAMEAEARSILAPFAEPNVGDDPINPAYYDGNACAEIIEYMPFNAGVAGKYVWRLGEKDPEDQECGKAAWYLDREIALHAQRIAPRPVFGLNHLDIRWYKDMALARIEARQMPMWRKALMMCLVEYTTSGQVLFLREAIAALRNEKRCDDIDCGRGLQP